MIRSHRPQLQFVNRKSKIRGLTFFSKVIGIDWKSPEFTVFPADRACGRCGSHFDLVPGPEGL
jgi:hypothetical protein